MNPTDKVEPGTFLIASPLLQDPNFVRTVVLMCGHGSEGSWGLVVNRRTGLTFGELLDGLPFPAAAGGPVFWGGPCETSRMQVLHRLRQEIPNDVEICRGIRLGVEPDRFRSLVTEARLPGEALNAYVGHAGWGAGQLESELEVGSWIVCTAESGIVFDSPPEEIWEKVLRSLGPKYASLARVPLDPRLN